MAKVEIYSSELCGYCRAAKKLLARKELDYIDYSVDFKPEVRAEMTHRAGGRTSVPQIFIDERHVGGYDDLAALDVAGELEGWLRAE